MNKFKVLLSFAIAKRLGNAVFVGWNILLCVIVMALMFADKIVLRLAPDLFAKQVVYVYELPEFVVQANGQETSMTFLALDDWGRMQAVLDEHAWIVHKRDDYQVLSNEDFSPLNWISLNQIILQFEDEKLREVLPEEEYLARLMPAVIPITMSKEKESSQTQTWAFLMITSIYFVALSYVGIAASDVVHEKSTRMMELILTCVSSTTHLIAKLLSGWLVLLIQVGIIAIDVLAAFALRYSLDKGAGLIKMMQEFGLLDRSSTFDFGNLLGSLLKQPMLLVNMFVGLVFMLIGILFVQTILVIFSSFIGSIEESGVIQSPFYMMFMAVYYLTIFLNTPAHMNDGIGKQLSMLPFFSMLFMPCRMFYYTVDGWEIATSFFIAMASLVGLWVSGAPMYQIGVLDYSSKSIWRKLMDSFRSFVAKPLFQRR